MSTDPGFLITPRRCAQARALLQIDRAELASRADVPEQDVWDFEEGWRRPRPAKLLRITVALAEAGITFDCADGARLIAR